MLLKSAAAGLAVSVAGTAIANDKKAKKEAPYGKSGDFNFWRANGKSNIVDSNSIPKNRMNSKAKLLAGLFSAVSAASKNYEFPRATLAAWVCVCSMWKNACGQTSG